MSARTWQEYGDGSILDRADSPEHGPAIRAYVRTNDDWHPDDNNSTRCSWEVTAEGPHGACDLVRGQADDLDHARELAQAALVAIAGCL